MRRSIATLLALPSGAALLAQVYGIAALDVGFAVFVAPSLVALAALGWSWRRSDPDLAHALLLGAAAGLAGSVLYDVVRIPAHLAGQRVFGAISVFGLWLTDAPASSRFTEVAGWGYHYVNGMTFGVLYAVWARRRHWAWGIVWALALESLAVFTRFGDLFLLRGNTAGIAIAYAAHVPYGLALGWPLWKWDRTRAQLGALTRGGSLVAVLLGLFIVFWPALSPYPAGRDAGASVGEFRIEGPRLVPGWLRVERGAAVGLRNEGVEKAVVVAPGQGTRIVVPAGGTSAMVLPQAGIQQVWVETGERSRSSFVLVEPEGRIDR